jgi:hypothetical protein
VPVDAVISSATLTLSIPVAPLALNTAELLGYAGDGVITAADLTLNNPLTAFQVSAVGSVVIPIDVAPLSATERAATYRTYAATVFSRAPVHVWPHRAHVQLAPVCSNAEFTDSCPV